MLSVAAGTAMGGLFTSAVSGGESLVSTLAGIGVESVKVAAQAESTSLALTTMIGSAGSARSLLRDLRTFANTTPFQFGELSTAAKQLLAMGVDAKDVVGSLRMIGDVSSGLNQPIGEMAYLFGQIRSRGNASSIELRELAMRGVPIYSELAKVLHTTTDGVREFKKEGEVGFDKIQAAFQSMTSEGGKFYNMTSQQSQTAAGLMSTLEDSIADVERQIGDALTTGSDGKSLLKEITDQITKLTPTAVEFGVSLAEAFKNALPAIKTAMESIQVMADQIGLIDLNKMNGNPYAAPKENVDAIGGAAKSDQNFDRLDRIQASNLKAAEAVADAYKDANGTDAKAYSEKIHDALQGVAKDFAAIKADRAAGKPVSDSDFQYAKDKASSGITVLGQYMEQVNKAMPSLQGAELDRANAALAAVRTAQADGQKVLAEIIRENNSQKRTQADAAERAKVGEWANGTPASDASAGTPTASESSSAVPASGGGGGGVGGGRLDIAKAEADALLRLLRRPATMRRPNC